MENRKIVVAVFLAMLVHEVHGLWGNDESEAKVDQLDVHRGKAVHSGFVYDKGRYVEPPYTVTRKGLEVFLNGIIVAGPPPRWPVVELKVDQDPGLPEGLTTESTIEDLVQPPNVQHSHLTRKQEYLFQHFPEDVAVQKLVEYFAALPFVRDATVSDNRFYKLTLNNGKEEGILIEPPGKGFRGLRAYTEEEMLGVMERERDRYERRLEDGDCLFFFQRHEMSFRKKKAARDLGLMVEILRSRRSIEEKKLLLRRMDILPPGSTQLYDTLFTDFEAADDLEKRIGELVKETKVKPRTIGDLPEETYSMRKHREMLEEQRRKKMKKQQPKECEPTPSAPRGANDSQPAKDSHTERGQVAIYRGTACAGARGKPRACANGIVGHRGLWSAAAHAPAFQKPGFRLNRRSVHQIGHQFGLDPDLAEDENGVPLGVMYEGRESWPVPIRFSDGNIAILRSTKEPTP